MIAMGIERPYVIKEGTRALPWRTYWPTRSGRVKHVAFHNWRDAYDFAYVLAHAYPPAERVS